MSQLNNYIFWHFYIENLDIIFLLLLIYPLLIYQCLQNKVDWFTNAVFFKDETKTKMKYQL